MPLWLCRGPRARRALRKGRKGSIGFVADERRINVGLTRARCSLIVIGNARALQYNQAWASLIHHTMAEKWVHHPGLVAWLWLQWARSARTPTHSCSRMRLGGVTGTV